MRESLYAWFATIPDAERAYAALTDQGANQNDITITIKEHNEGEHPVEASTGSATFRREEAEHTPAQDAVGGAHVGAAVGVGLGALAALAALAIPGVGLVLGGGALAAAVGGVVGAGVAGAAAGGAYGFLKEHGASDEVVGNYSQATQQGGAVMSVTVPSGNLAAEEIEKVLLSSGGRDIGVYPAPAWLNPIIDQPHAAGEPR